MGFHASIRRNIPSLLYGSGFNRKTQMVGVNLSAVMWELWLQRYHRIFNGEALGGDQGGRVGKSRVNASQ